jgi:hypothetical protein
MGAGPVEALLAEGEGLLGATELGGADASSVRSQVPWLRVVGGD